MKTITSDIKPIKECMGCVQKCIVALWKTTSGQDSPEKKGNESLRKSHLFCYIIKQFYLINLQMLSMNGLPSKMGNTGKKWEVLTGRSR